MHANLQCRATATTPATTAPALQTRTRITTVTGRFFDVDHDVGMED